MNESYIDMNLDKLLEAVHSKETFSQFVKALKEDKMDEDEKEKNKPSSPYASGANGWENGEISAFLNAVERYGKDSNSISEEPSWKNFALLLYAGKFYE
jgi:hypothetical protein